MKKFLLIILISSMACDTGNLTVIADLPKTLKEVSGMEYLPQRDEIWMLNDGGNKARLYRIDSTGKIRHELRIDAKNKDWEDMTSDPEGNLYIGDFGNNLSKRTNLSILKVKSEYLESMTETPVERISFKYPNQTKFPPKKKQMHFDCEAMVFHNDSLYIFTKSRVRGNFGRTDLYRIPAKRGQHIAQFLGTFTTCDDLDCWITGADSSEDGKQLVLLTPQSVWLFKNYQNGDFFEGNVSELMFDHSSQKESICFKTDSLLYIADEFTHGSGGNLYEFSID